MTIQNSNEFDMDEYDPKNAITGESIMKWQTLSYSQRLLYDNEIQRNNLITHDSFLNLGQSLSFDYFSIFATETQYLNDREAY